MVVAVDLAKLLDQPRVRVNVNVAWGVYRRIVGRAAHLAQRLEGRMRTNQATPWSRLSGPSGPSLAGFPGAEHVSHELRERPGGSDPDG